MFVLTIVHQCSPPPICTCTHVSISNYTIIKRGVHLISRVGSILKWPPQWIYYNLHAYTSHKQFHFAYIKTYKVFLSVANSTRNANTCSGIADTTQPRKWKIHHFFLSFFSTKTLLRNNTSIQQAVRVNLQQKHCAYYHLRDLAIEIRMDCNLQESDDYWP